MIDQMFQATSRQNVLDDLADALPGETLVGPFTLDDLGNVQDIWGGTGVGLNKVKNWQWRLLIEWKDNYISTLLDGVPGSPPVKPTEIMRGLHVNWRFHSNPEKAPERGEEIAALVNAYFTNQVISSRDWADNRVFQARGKSSAGQVHRTIRGTSWLQGDDPAGDGYVADQSFRFG